MEKMITFWLGFSECDFGNRQEMNAFVFNLVRNNIIRRNPETNEQEMVKDKVCRTFSPNSGCNWVPLKSVDDLIWSSSGEFHEDIVIPELPNHLFTHPAMSISETEENKLNVDLTLDFSKTGAISMNPQKFNKDQIASIFANYAKKWFPLFKPQYAWVDLEIPQTYNQIKAVKIVHQPWVSIYGPEYVAKYSKEFLLGIPAYKTEEINDGRNGKAVYVQLSQNFTDKASYPPFEKLVEYMVQKGIKLKPYRPKEMLI